MLPSTELKKTCPDYCRKSENGDPISDREKHVCNDMNVTFVDNQSNLTFKNGDVDASAFHANDIHLSASGQSALKSVPPQAGGAASVVGRFSRAPQIQSSNLLTEMEIISTDDHNWYSKQPSQH